MFALLLACILLTESGKEPVDTAPNTADDTGCSSIFDIPDGCNGLDDDCDGLVDENPELSWYADNDGDGYGDGELQWGCEVPGLSSSVDGDCDDEEPRAHPGADEVCDGIDNDCNGSVDPDDSVDVPTWYPDLDQDGHGVDSNPKVQCEAPPKSSLLNDDCDDAEATISPSDPEICFNDLDDDCNGTVDEHCIVEHCGDITTNQTWDNTRVHQLTCSIEVGGSADPILTVLAGTTLWFDDGTYLGSGNTGPGQIRMQGTTSSRVNLTSTREYKQAPWQGIWGGLQLGPQDSGSTFESMDMRWAGGGTAALTVTGTQLALTDSSVSMSDTYGVSLDDNSVIAAWSNNVLKENIWPIVLPLMQAGELDNGSTFSPNSDDLVWLRPGSVTTDLTLAALDAAWVMDGVVAVGGGSGVIFTLEDGATLVFEEDATLTVGASGPATLVADGSVSGITIGSRDKQVAGSWLGLTFGAESTGSAMTGVTIQYGGANGEGCLLLSGGELEMTDTVVQDCGEAGVIVQSGSFTMDGGSVLNAGTYGLELEGGTLDVQGVTISGSGTAPIRVLPDAMGAIASDCTLTGNTLDAVVVSEGTATVSATWAALGVPWQAEGDLLIDSTATVTVTDGLTLAFEPLTWLVVEGTLDVQGAATGVTFTSSESSPAAGDWAGFRVSEGAVATLDGLLVEYGGGSGSALMSEGDLTLTSSEFDSNQGCVSATGAFEMTDTVITGCIGAPLKVSAELLDIDPSNTLTGNVEDHVVVTGGDISSDLTWPALDVDWLVTGTVEVGSGATLTVEEGVLASFEPGVSLRVGEQSSGALVLDGSSANPIVLTGSTLNPAAGDWVGVVLGTSCDATTTSLQWAEIAYAGSDGTGNLTLRGCDATLTDLVLADSAAWGLYLDGASPWQSNITFVGNAYGASN